MNLQILNFYDDKTQITKKYFCKNHGGENKSPKVVWKKIPEAKSYSLIMEDPLSIYGITVHWFIPTIYDKKIIYGLNSYDKLGWYGPCPPFNNNLHKYIFTLYSLDKILNYDVSKKIKSSSHFEQILKDNDIKILNKEIVIFDYDAEK